VDLRALRPHGFLFCWTVAGPLRDLQSLSETNLNSWRMSLGTKNRQNTVAIRIEGKPGLSGCCSRIIHPRACHARSRAPSKKLWKVGYFRSAHLCATGQLARNCIQSAKSVYFLRGYYGSVERPLSDASLSVVEDIMFSRAGLVDQSPEEILSFAWQVAEAYESKIDQNLKVVVIGGQQIRSPEPDRQGAGWVCVSSMPMSHCWRLPRR
jgi:hypothetical protein